MFLGIPTGTQALASKSERDQVPSGRGVMRRSVGFDLCDREGDAARHD